MALAVQPGPEVALASRVRAAQSVQKGRLVTPQFGPKTYVANAILTDLPLAADS